MANKKAEAADAKKDDRRWRVVVDFLPMSGSGDLTLKAKDQEEAEKLVSEMLKNGYVVLERADDPSKYFRTYFPTVHVRSVTIYEAAE